MKKRHHRARTEKRSLEIKNSKEVKKYCPYCFHNRFFKKRGKLQCTKCKQFVY